MQNAIAASKPKMKYEERYSFLNIVMVLMLVNYVCKKIVPMGNGIVETSKINEVKKIATV